MRTTHSQTSFIRGEVSPLLQGRTSADVYKSSVLEALNCSIHPLGPIQKRKGLKYISEVKTSSSKVRLVPYRYTVETSYILEFGHNYVRFYTERERLETGGVPLELSTTYTTSQILSIQYYQVGSKLYITHPEHPPRVIERLGASTWTLSLVKLYPEPTFEDGYTDTSTTMTPGATSGSGVTFTSSAGVLFLASAVGRQIVNLTGSGRAVITSVTDATHAVCTIVENFPSTATMGAGTWKLDLSPITTITPSGTALGSIINLTASSASWVNAYIGQYVKINGGVVKIVSVTSNTVAVGEVQKTLTSASASTTFTVESPSWTSTRGYPSSVTCFEQRLFFAGSPSDPVTIWGSASGDFSDFGNGALPADSVTFDLNNGSSISWMSSNRELIIGGEAGEVSISAGDNSAISPTNIIQRVRTPHGSNSQVSIDLPNEVVFVQRSGSKLRSLSYDYSVDGYSALDLSLIADHIFNIGIVEAAATQNPHQVIYSILTDGSVASTTYLRQNSSVGGVLGTALMVTEGEVESLAVVQNGPVDDVYFSVKRVVNGATKRYIEVLMPDEGELDTDIFSDCTVVKSNPKEITDITLANPGVVTAPAHGFSNGDMVIIKDSMSKSEFNNRTYKVSNATTNTFELDGIDTSGYLMYNSIHTVMKLQYSVSDLDHLEGKTVQIKCDGATHPNLVVSSGVITLQEPAGEVTVGLAYNMSVTTLPLEYQSAEGDTNYGQPSRRPRPILKVYRSSYPNLNNQVPASRNTRDYMDSKVPLFTGNIKYSSTAWGDDSQINITSSEPLPVTIIGIYGTVEGNVK